MSRQDATEQDILNERFDAEKARKAAYANLDREISSTGAKIRSVIGDFGSTFSLSFRAACTAWSMAADQIATTAAEKRKL